LAAVVKFLTIAGLGFQKFMVFKNAYFLVHHARFFSFLKTWIFWHDNRHGKIFEIF
jgi:hypothetical protein